MSPGLPRHASLQIRWLSCEEPFIYDNVTSLGKPEYLHLWFLVRPYRYLFILPQGSSPAMGSTNTLGVSLEVPVLIVGGGPSGLLAAYLLSRLGGRRPS